MPPGKTGGLCFCDILAEHETEIAINYVMLKLCDIISQNLQKGVDKNA